MRNYISLFQQIAQELKWTTSSCYQHCWNGETNSFVISSQEERDNEIIIKTVKHLTQFIYFYYYLGNHDAIKQMPSQRPTEVKPIIMLEDPVFTQKLQTANKGTGYISPGWQVVSIESNGIVVQQNNIRLFAQRSEIFSSNNEIPKNEVVSLSMPKDIPYMHPGYYTIIGNEGFYSEKSVIIIRLYCNILPEYAPDFIEHLTSLLNIKHIKYSIKVLNNPVNYTRPDTVVLYLAYEAALTIWQDLQILYEEKPMAFANRTPSFAKQLATGIAVAEEPDMEGITRMSFGQHRSFLIAHGLLYAFQQTQNTAEERYQSIVNTFLEKNLTIERPYLNANREDNYMVFKKKE